VARSKSNQSRRYSPTLEALVRAAARKAWARPKRWKAWPATPASAACRVQLGGGGRHPDGGGQCRFLPARLGVGAGTLASLALLAWLAWRTARGISGPIEALKQAATDLGAGQPVTLQPLDVEELDAVGRRLRKSAADRDLASERRAR
jgi:hypothetical protein